VIRFIALICVDDYASVSEEPSSKECDLIPGREFEINEFSGKLYY